MSARNLFVIIVGGGIGGLAAAIALRRAGHSIRVFERSVGGEIGAGIALGPNATRILDSWDFDYERAQIAPYRGTELLTADTLKSVVPFRDPNKAKYGSRMRTAHRADLYDELFRLATRPEGPGQPAEVRTECLVTSYDANAGSITLDSGSVEQADLVIAADGFRSPAGLVINGPSCPKVRPSRTTLIRFMIPSSAITGNPETVQMLPEHSDVGTFYIAPDKKRYVVRYPVRNATLQNFALLTIQDDTEQADEVEWRFKCDRAALRHELRGFHPLFMKMSEMTSEILPVWRATHREPLDKWSKGRLVVLGDAAHPMLPNIGAGALAAIEDAAALGELLAALPQGNGERGDLDQSLADALRIYEEIRKPHATVCQLYSDIPPFRDAVVEQKLEARKYLKANELPVNRAGLPDWQYGYDVVVDIKQRLSGTENQQPVIA